MTLESPATEADNPKAPMRVVSSALLDPKVVCSDNCEAMRVMETGSVDLVVTSPPYDDLRTYGGLEWDFYGVAWNLKRLLKPGGVIVWIVNDETRDGSETGTSMRQALHFQTLGLNLHDTMVWNKGSCRFPETNRYYPTWEYMFVLSKGKPKTYNLIADRKNLYVGQRVAREKQIRTRDGRMIENSANRIDPDREIKEIGVRFNIWNDAVAASTDEKTGHPAMFPESLVKDHITTWTNPGEIVLDPFAGSGTTIKAAKELGRQAIGIEINPEYVKIINNRLRQDALALGV
jgi:site-specific DNA-methyltransferase (adenine-specific)